MTVGNFELAAKHFMRAMELQPDDYESLLHLAAVLRSVGRKDEAEKYARLGLKRAEAALRLHPEISKPARSAPRAGRARRARPCAGMAGSGIGYRSRR